MPEPAPDAAAAAAGPAAPTPAPPRRRWRIFGSALPGAAGHFTRGQLAALAECLPQGALKHVELDHKVRKAEGDGYGAWWEARAPSTAPPPAAPITTASSGARPPPAPLGDRRAWLLASVGLRAQGALARLLHPPQAPAGPPADSGAAAQPSSLTAVRSSQGAADESIGASAGSPPPVSIGPQDHPGAAAAPPPGAAEGAAAVAYNVSRASGAGGMRALWNLDRLDQRALPLDGVFGRPDSGSGVTIYTVDSGINPHHQEFGGWDGAGVTRASQGPNIICDDPNPSGAASNDCDGHGSHVASTAVGRGVGVASSARVVAVKVLDCQGEGSISDVVEGLDWVAANARKPAVVTLSLGVPSGNWSAALEEAVRAVVRSGVTAVVAAGNSQVDACTIAPASVDEAVTVAATNLPSKFGAPQPGDIETLYSWGNTGPW
ncbi:peptidase S8/S53 subtilisin kexin sedolisin [Monoraphidium neglectum]|uniref:Peptidase S8/S53 subtilisin kexin sedolisin n=1 Tax=Monoraphidium neglectum TaxID=145388 RepID=A0A0D2KXX6_9CHLO|nr:peptidase S8/S53 subtilisin kexin sedolisin [Monoraphidium neglectum]KIZ00099.1 peptidase S8/S53 subtilisin kexin sedolisin [Monoraphidium neglectum]|eukprot:XP_013899118.1 peptidase S8/S53 subtilisin kexin sedolisin [Monoraphidium neglectum]